MKPRIPALAHVCAATAATAWSPARVARAIGDARVAQAVRGVFHARADARKPVLGNAVARNGVARHGAALKAVLGNAVAGNAAARNGVAAADARSVTGAALR